MRTALPFLVIRGIIKPSELNQTRNTGCGQAPRRFLAVVAVSSSNNLSQTLNDALGLGLFPAKDCNALMLGNRQPGDQVRFTATRCSSVTSDERGAVCCFGLPPDLCAPEVFAQVVVKQALDLLALFRCGYLPQRVEIGWVSQRHHLPCVSRSPRGLKPVG